MGAGGGRSWAECVVSVEELDVQDVVFAPVRVGHRLVYSHADGGVGCLVEDAKRPGGAFFRGESVGACVCLDLHDERDVRWEEDVVGCLVEVAGRLVHWDGEDQVCAMVARPGAEVVLDGQGGAGSAVGGFYGDVVDHGDVVEDHLGVVVRCGSYEAVGLLFGGSDEGGSYEVAVAPSSYQFPVQVVVPVGQDFWERNEVWVRDLFGEEGADRLYFFLRRGGSDVESGGSCPAGGGDVGVAGGLAEEVCEGFEDVVSHGGSPFLEHGGGSVVASVERGGFSTVASVGCDGRSVVAPVGTAGGSCLSLSRLGFRSARSRWSGGFGLLPLGWGEGALVAPSHPYCLSWVVGASRRGAVVSPVPSMELASGGEVLVFPGQGVLGI